MVNLKISTMRALMGDAVRVVISTILFHRMLGPINPKTVESLGVTYAVPESSELEEQIRQKLDQLAAILSENKRSAEIVLRFFDPSSKKAWFNWSNDSCWEEWVIRCNLEPEGENSMARIQSDLRDLILRIVQVMDRQKEHIPPITTKNMVSFPYEISVN